MEGTIAPVGVSLKRSLFAEFLRSFPNIFYRHYINTERTLIFDVSLFRTKDVYELLTFRKNTKRSPSWPDFLSLPFLWPFSLAFA